MAIDWANKKTPDLGKCLSLGKELENAFERSFGQECGVAFLTQKQRVPMQNLSTAVVTHNCEEKDDKT